MMVHSHHAPLREPAVAGAGGGGGLRSLSQVAIIAQARAQLCPANTGAQLCPANTSIGRKKARGISKIPLPALNAKYCRVDVGSITAQSAIIGKIFSALQAIESGAHSCGSSGPGKQLAPCVLSASNLDVYSRLEAILQTAARARLAVSAREAQLQRALAQEQRRSVTAEECMLQEKRTAEALASELERARRHLGECEAARTQAVLGAEIVNAEAEQLK
eukprot:SAG11_NODE_7364_length_1155_cov_2.303977_1_plen_218_part_10